MYSLQLSGVSVPLLELKELGADYQGKKKHSMLLKGYEGLLKMAGSRIERKGKVSEGLLNKDPSN